MVAEAERGKPSAPREAAADRPEFRVLSREKVEAVHNATLRVLEEIGVDVYEPQAVEMLKRAGCSVEGERRVRLGRELVEWAIRAAPEGVGVCDREGQLAMLLQGDRVYFGTGSDCPNVIDLESGKRRPATMQDVVQLAKLCDALPEIDFVMSMALPTQADPRRVDVEVFLAMVTNTSKPLCFTAFSFETLEEILEMCALIAGGREALAEKPFVVHYSEPISPLMHGKEAVQKLLLCADWRVPIVYASGLMAGASGPVTLAGALVTGNAEGLSGLVMSQLRQEGAPFVYGGFVTIMDMATSIFSYGAPELHLMSAALADMAHFYRLPVWGTAGMTDSKRPDSQAAVEATSACLMAALSGANLVHDIGYLESGLTSSYTTPVMNDEIIGLVRRIIKGIEVSEETLAVDVIGQVGPGKAFLGEEHTLRHFRKEFWFPTTFDRNRHDIWAAKGGKSADESVVEKARAILSEHRPKPLAEPLLAKLRSGGQGRSK